MPALSSAQLRRAAERFDKAERTRKQVRPLTFDFPDMDMVDAHAVQDAWVGMKVARGARVRGRKVGLTSKAMQRAMNIAEPDYGTLLDDMFFEDGAEIEAANFLDPRVEVEIAFVLDRPLAGESVTVEEALAATRAVHPSLELIAARSFRVDPQTGRARTVIDTIADNAAAAGVVLGGRGFDPSQVDLPWAGGILYRNGEVEETGLAAGVLGHPANGVCWLARRLARHGIALEPDDVILSGSFTQPVEARAGDELVADFGALGRIECRFI